MGNNNIYTSAFLAFGSYLLLILLILLYMSVDDVKEFKTVSKNTILELEVIVIKDKKVEKKAITKQKNIVNTKIAKSVVKKSASTSVKKRTNLKSLFADVSTKARVTKKQKVSTVKKSTVASRFKSKFEKESKKEKVSVSKLTDTKKIKTSKSVPIKNNNNSSVDDKYLDKINAIFMERYNQLLRISGFEAIVNIFINSSGKFTYNIIQYSDDGAFNSQLELFLEKQRAFSFPSHPDKNSYGIKITFSTKDNN